MRRPVVLALSALALWWAPAAQAASNACNFSVDDYWTSVDVTIDGVGTPASVLPGDTVTLKGAHATAALPQYLAQIGYNTGFLHAGENVIPVRVWAAVQATNTLEGTRVAGPVDVEAKTTITTNATGAFVSATPIAYAPPELPEMTWTAAGGDVVFSQAPAGAITQQLPIGPNGALRRVGGSAVILADLNPAVFSMDCQPGRGNDGGNGPVVAAPTPFDTRPGPLNETCRTDTGAIVPLGVRFSGPAFNYRAGTPVALSGARLQVALGVPDGPASATVTIRGAGTTEGAQTVVVTSAIVNGVFDGVLPDTTWTPAGSGPITFSQAPSGPSRAGTVLVRFGTELRECIAGTEAFDNPSPPVFATATIPPPPAATATPIPTPVATAPPGGGGAPAPVPTVIPQPAVGAISVRSTKLVVRRGKVKLVLACSRAGACSGTLAIRGVVKARKYALAAGKSKTYTLSVGRTRSRKVKLVLTPASGKAVTKTLSLRT